MIITTASRSTTSLVEKAKKLAHVYKLNYKERQGRSIETLKEHHKQDIVIVEKEQLSINPLIGKSQLFFHPNLAMLRAKRIIKGEVDPFIQATQLKQGMSFLDCTLGLAADSLIASLVLGELGAVTGLEGNRLLYVLTKEGLSSFSTEMAQLKQAMRRINVVHTDHHPFLEKAETDSVDVVYFDPMFDAAITTSDGMNAIREQGLTTELTPAIINEAERVARKRVVLKDHWQSRRFKQLGFTQYKRKTALFHYGTIEIGDKKKEQNNGH